MRKQVWQAGLFLSPRGSPLTHTPVQASNNYYPPSDCIPASNTNHLPTQQIPNHGCSRGLASTSNSCVFPQLHYSRTSDSWTVPSYNKTTGSAWICQTGWNRLVKSPGLRPSLAIGLHSYLRRNTQNGICWKGTGGLAVVTGTR